MRACVRNLAIGATTVTPSSGTAPGYSIGALRDGMMALPWLSAFSSTLHTITITRPAPDVAFDLLALFDVRAEATILGATAYRMDGVDAVELGPIELSSRGDGAIILPVPQVGRSWRIAVALDAAAPLQIGEVWIGETAALPPPSEVTAVAERSVMVNGEWARMLARGRIHLTMSWPPVEGEESRSLLGLDDEAQGPLHPVVVLPDEGTPSEIYIGRISDSAAHTLDPNRLYSGHRIEIIELGRAL